MSTLKIHGDDVEKVAGVEPGSWGYLVAWFSELVDRLDKGNLPGAVEAQKELEEHGFKVTFRRRPRQRRR